MLHKNEYVPFAPEGDDEQIYTYHQNCPAVEGGGKDHKRRLAIRRTEGGNIILGYCHHCGQSGSYSQSLKESGYFNGGVTKPSTQSTSAVKVVNGEFKLPKGFTTNVGEWPVRARQWLFKYGLSLEEVKKYGIGCVNDDVVFPIYSSNGDVIGYNLRSTGTGNKYLLYVPSGTSYPVSGGSSGSVLCIVEDIVSAIRVGRFLDSVALLGANLSDKVLRKAAKYKRVHVFLDDDNTHIKMQQQRIKAALELVCTDVRVVQVGKDPKHCTDEELKEVLDVTYTI